MTDSRYCWKEIDALKSAVAQEKLQHDTSSREFDEAIADFKRIGKEQMTRIAELEKENAFIIKAKMGGLRVKKEKSK